MKPYYKKDGITIYHADALALLATLDANSVNLIATDPPYFRVLQESWDRQWPNAEKYLAWIGQLCQEFQRVLKSNGSLYLFASPQMAGRVEVVVRKWFNVLNSIVWVKGDAQGNGQHNKAHKDDLRSYFPRTERIIFAEHHGADSFAKGIAGYELACDRLKGFVFEPIRAYLDEERQRAGLTQDQVNEICGTVSMAGRHYFSRSQWCMPTSKHYAAMQEGFNRLASGGNGKHLRREYEDLRREYEDLRRPFTVTPLDEYTDIWEFQTVLPYPGKHPAEKPLALMEHIIRASSQSGDLVLDPFMGHGTTLLAARNLGRRAIGGELAEKWQRRTVARLARSFEERAEARTPGACLCGARRQADSLAALPMFAN